MREQQTMDEIEVATDLLLASVEALREEQLREPSLLPEWSRAQLLTHVARGAESLCRLLEWARTGVEEQQYAGADVRSRDIDAGARRPVSAQAADLRATAALFDDAVEGLPPAAWDAEVRTDTGEVCRPARLLYLRLRELEMHHVDLDVGYTFADVPEHVAALVIDDILTTLSAAESAPALRIEATDTDLRREIGHRGPLVSGPQVDLLGYLSGRTPGTGLSVSGGARESAVPVLPPWI